MYLTSTPTQLQWANEGRSPTSFNDLGNGFPSSFNFITRRLASFAHSYFANTFSTSFKVHPHSAATSAFWFVPTRCTTTNQPEDPSLFHNLSRTPAFQDLSMTYKEKQPNQLVTPFAYLEGYEFRGT